MYINSVLLNVDWRLWQAWLKHSWSIVCNVGCSPVALHSRTETHCGSPRPSLLPQSNKASLLTQADFPRSLRRGSKDPLFYQPSTWTFQRFDEGYFLNTISRSFPETKNNIQCNGLIGLLSSYGSLCKEIVPFKHDLLDFTIVHFMYTNLLPFILIGPESDLCLALSITHWLTHWFTPVQ